MAVADELQRAQEREWIRQAQAGDTAAFGRLVERYQRVVYNIAYYWTRQQQDAEDVAQEAFVRAYQALDRFDAERPLAPWLYRIARNTALNWIKRRRPGVELDEGLLPAGTGPEEQVLATAAAERLHAALADMPPHYRAAVELRHWQGLSYQEMSEALDAPLSDVKSWLFRARRALRRVLFDEGWADEE